VSPDDTDNADIHTDADTDRSDEAQRLIDAVADRKGREWAETHADLILSQARLVGEYDPDRVLQYIGGDAGTDPSDSSD